MYITKFDIQHEIQDVRSSMFIHPFSSLCPVTSTLVGLQQHLVNLTILTPFWRSDVLVRPAVLNARAGTTIGSSTALLCGAYEGTAAGTFLFENVDCALPKMATCQLC